MADVIDQMSEVMSEALHRGVIPQMDDLISATAVLIDRNNPPVEELSKMGTALWDLFCNEVASGIVSCSEAAMSDGSARSCPNCADDLVIAPFAGGETWVCSCGYSERR